MLTNKLTGAGAADKTYIEDVFSTYLYTGNGSTQTINNGIDLAGKGGLVWLKQRNAVQNNLLFNSVSGTDRALYSNSTSAVQDLSGVNPTFTSSGFSFPNGYSETNSSGQTYASWTFRKAPKFFDVVTYTGNGVAGRQIPHSLGVAPGMIVVKRISPAQDWAVYHRSLGASSGIYLNTTSAASAVGWWNSTAPTSTLFTVGGTGLENQSGLTYVAYLFAHDTSTDGLIQCGSFTCDSSGNAEVNLGWEPQYVMLKLTNTTSDWSISDSMRGNPTSGTQKILWPNLNIAEIDGGGYGYPTATGMRITGWTSGNQGIYMAIRRGPMRTPTDGTKVFKPVTYSGDDGVNRVITGVGFAGDLMIGANRSGMVGQTYDRLRGKAIQLRTVGTDAEVNRGGSEGYMGMSDFTVDWNQGVLNTSGYNYASWIFRRAPGFFDVVCFNQTTSTDQRVSHSLNSTPELIILKSRVNSNGWFIWHKLLPINAYLQLNTTAFSAITSLNFWGQSLPTTTTFGLNHDQYGTDGQALVAYLFASCPGVSKVGSFTGNGSSQTINCGFSAGARFVLIKRTDSTGAWYVWDTARGIVSANDPHLRLNTTAAEVTTDDTIDPDSTGFIVNQVAATNVNVSGGSYIYLAIA